jgi:hypothetical protein
MAGAVQNHRRLTDAGLRWKPESEALAQKRNGKAMQHKTLSTDGKNAVQLNKAQSELQSQFDTGTTRPVPNDAPQPIRPEESGTVCARAKTMAGSGPGSEYWLP